MNPNLVSSAISLPLTPPTHHPHPEVRLIMMWELTWLSVTFELGHVCELFKTSRKKSCLQCK